MQTILEAFLLIFMAELGDKSMLLAMTFATRFPLKQVIPGIFLGILANHGVAVLIGSQAGRLLPTHIIAPLSGILFLFFALSNLKLEEEEEEEHTSAKTIWLAVAIAFFIGEFGDKTQITAMTLASQEPAILVLAGTVTAMMCTSLLSILVGTKLGEKIPEFQMRIASGVVFYLFGMLKLREAITGPLLYLVAFGVGIVFLFLAMRLYNRSKEQRTAMQETAALLKEQVHRLADATEKMCLGEGVCGKCEGAHCMIGYVKILLGSQEEHHSVDVHTLVQKTYPEETVEEGLAIILTYFQEHGWDEKNSLQHQVRQIFEKILFGHAIEAESLESYQLQLIEEERLSASPRLRSIGEQSQRTYD